MECLKDIDFPSLIAKEHNGRMRIRLMALSHINNGVNRTQTAKYLHVSRRMVNEWVKRFNEKGIDGLIESLVLVVHVHYLLSSWVNLKSMSCPMPSSLMGADSRVPL
jgi:hypothetical protein